MYGRRVFQLVGRDGDVFLSSDGGGAEVDSEEVGGSACTVELQRTQTERVGVDLWLRRSIEPGGIVTSPNREMSQSIRGLSETMRVNQPSNQIKYFHSSLAARVAL